MKTISRYIMTLVALLAVTTQAWATDVYLVGNGDGNWLNGVAWDPGVADNKMTEQNGVYSITFTNVAANPESPFQFMFAINGTWDVTYGCTSDTENELNKTLSNIDASGGNYILFGLTETADVTISFNLSEMTYMISTKGMKVGDDASSGPEVAWNAETKTGTFTMPAYDVVLTPLYAPSAKWDVVENVEQLPAALEGVIAGQDAAIVTAGQSAQGTVMYAVTTSAEAAPALTAFSATVPTAKDYDDAATLYVWYYIQGQDTPDGQEATEENTFNDSEICATPLKVDILTNKFDIQFNAANANTIEAGKATVTVGGTAATVTEGKLEGVKMGSEVKLKANTGYKFRKVEVKKKEAAPSLSITNPEVGQVIGSDGKNYDADATLPSGVTAVAKICYVSGSNGLALALTDEEGEMDWSTAQTTCAAHTPAFTGGTWKLASMDEWKNMINAIGSYDDLRDGFSSVGGTNLSEAYWSSTESGSDFAWFYDFDGGYWDDNARNGGLYVRACLAF